MSFARDTLAVFVTRVFMFLSGMATSIIVARLLGPDGKGTFALAILTAELSLTFIHLGAGSAAVYYRGKRRFSPPEAAAGLLILGIALGGLSLAAFRLVSPLLDRTLLGGVPPRLSLIAMLAVPAALIGRYGTYLLLGQRQMLKFNVMHALPQPLVALGIVALMLSGRLSVLAAVVCWAFSRFVAGLLSFALPVRGEGIRFTRVPHVLSSLVGYGVLTHFVLIANYLHHRGDVFLVNYFRSTENVGLYTVAVGAADILLFLSSAVGVVLFREVALRAERSDRAPTALVVRWTNLSLCAGAIVLGLVARPLIHLLYGPRFSASFIPCLVLLPGTIAYGTFTVLSSDLIGRGRAAAVGVTACAAVLVNFALNVITIPRIGITGAALSSTVSYTALAIATAVIEIRVVGNRARDLALPSRRDFMQMRRLLGSMLRRGAAAQALSGAMPADDGPIYTPGPDADSE